MASSKITSQKGACIVHSLRMDLAIRKRKGSGATLLLAFGLGAILFSALFFGCTQLEGWGVVIWSVKGTSAKSGTVVPVYLKSNISKSYLIGLPDDDKTKIEVPFTSLEFFHRKGPPKSELSSLRPTLPSIFRRGAMGFLFGTSRA